MAFTNYEANFSAVLPAMRSFTDITADIDAGRSGRATDISKSKLAEIEMQIARGDDLYRRRQYEPALNAFRTARASIYALLYPGFRVSAWVAAKDITLPVSKVLEKGLIETSLRITDSLRPLAVERNTAFRQTIAEPVPKALAAFTKSGFHEALGLDEALQEAAAEGVAFLQDGKPEAAIDIMSDALTRAANPAAAADRSITSALHLNLATAFIQAGDFAKATEAAKQARTEFERGLDLIGLAQATHVAAVAAQRSGNEQLAKQLFNSAAETLKAVTGSVGTLDEPLPSFAASSSVAVSNVAALATRNLTVLKPIAAMQASTLTLRVPGRADGWSAVAVADEVQKRQLSKPWELGVPAGEGLATLKFASNATPGAADLVSAVYQPRVAVGLSSKLNFQIVDTSSTAVYLTQLYAYSLPVKIGDCYHELGQFAPAENSYQQAAAYSFLNSEVEATSLWMRMATNTLEWGEALYKNDEVAPAKDQYGKLIGDNTAVPNSFLYTTASLANPANAAKSLIQNIQQRPLPEINWEITYLILTAFSRLQQIAQGLDFYGLLLSPIHTFEYLQSVARGFAQEAIQAEREFVNFKTRQETSEATRRELETAKAMANAEAEGRKLQWDAAQEDETAADRAVKLAIKRRDDAVAERAAYAATSSAEIWARAAAQALGGGQDGLYNEISELADKLARGETISGKGPKLAAAQTLYAGRKTREYELKKMQDNIDELNKNILVAQSQLAAATARTAAAEVAYRAALKRGEMAAASLKAFDDQFFTPEAWDKMGNVMRSISRDYLYRAIRIAKLMERAFNFDNDTDLKVIKNEYGFNIATPAAGRDVRLLGGDSLMQDIDSFTYNAIATKTRKSSRIKDVISIANNFPAQFESFRQTGLLSFETDLYEFDRLHPGFFAQRLEAVEIEVIGLLPESGMNGTLSGGGVTAFRRKDNTAGKRTHVVDTMALSDFVLRGDAFLYGTETGVRGLFQGFGPGCTWQLHLPKRSNAFDFRRIFDVNLVLYYNAQFDTNLRSTVLALPPRDGELSLLRTFGMRSDFPDAWYSFYRVGAATIQFDALRLPANQTNFKTQKISFRVVTRERVSNQNIQVRVTGPDNTTGTHTTDANGMVSSERPELAGLAGATPVGAWKIEVLDGASLKVDGVLQFDRVYNVQIGLEYTFDFVPEEL